MEDFEIDDALVLLRKLQKTYYGKTIDNVIQQLESIEEHRGQTKKAIKENVTKEEFFSQYCERCYQNIDCAFKKRGMQCNELDCIETGIEFAEENAPKWIDCNDELPEFGVEVLVCNKYDPENFWFSIRTDRGNEHGFHNPSTESITHWMYVPKLK